jgi:hypothetical protein
MKALRQEEARLVKQFTLFGDSARVEKFLIPRLARHQYKTEYQRPIVQVIVPVNVSGADRDSCQPPITNLKFREEGRRADALA